MTQAVFEDALPAEPALLLSPLLEHPASTNAAADASTASETNELRFTSRSPLIAVSEVSRCHLVVESGIGIMPESGLYCTRLSNRFCIGLAGGAGQYQFGVCDISNDQAAQGLP